MFTLISNMGIFMGKKFKIKTTEESNNWRSPFLNKVRAMGNFEIHKKQTKPIQTNKQTNKHADSI